MKPDDNQQLKDWLKAQRPYAARGLKLAALLGALGGILAVAQAWGIAKVIDGAVFKQQDLHALLPWLWALLPILLVRFLAAWGAERQAVRGALAVKRAIRAQLFDRIRGLGPIGLADERSGTIASSLLEGVEGLEPYFARYLPAASLVGMVPMVIALAVLPADWLSAVVLLVTAPLIPVFMILIGRRAERVNQRQWQQLARMGGHFLDVLQGLTTLKLFNASRRELDQIARVSDDFRRSTMSVLRVAFLTSAVLEFFAAISIAIIAVLIGFRLLDGEMAFLYGLFVLLLAPEFYLPLRNLGVQNHARMEAIGAAENIVRLLDREPLLPGAAATGAIPPAGDIRFEQVVFAYEPGRSALNGLDLHIAHGAHVALVGRSGSGKSTVANLLLRFVTPQQGRVLLDGQPIDTFDHAAWQAAVAWIPQRPRLFAATVADNIRLGRPDASDDAVYEAARRAQALDFIERLPDGLATRVGEGGRGLSGGQTQRLAVARALLRDCPLVVLDEPTAHLDPASQARVQSALDELAKGRTVLTIAHRLETIRQVSQIIVLDQGAVVEQGSFAELSKRGGHFSALLRDTGELVA
ncbi:MAG: thiol reductant ABC exporter subunit CydD [Chromatiaceae bacterium]|nr:thiol reductant ABC exporter subunit CydD [Chromatiaceae bacterium]